MEDEDKFMENIFHLHEAIWNQTITGIHKMLRNTEWNIKLIRTDSRGRIAELEIASIKDINKVLFSIELRPENWSKPIDNRFYYGYVFIRTKLPELKKVFEEYNLQPDRAEWIPTRFNSYSRSFVRKVKCLALDCRKAVFGTLWVPDIFPKGTDRDNVSCLLPDNHVFRDFRCQLPAVTEQNCQWVITTTAWDPTLQLFKRYHRTEKNSEWPDNLNKDSQQTTMFICFKNFRTGITTTILTAQCEEDIASEYYHVEPVFSEKYRKDFSSSWDQLPWIVFNLLDVYINYRKSNDSFNYPELDDIHQRTNAASQFVWHTMNKLLQSFNEIKDPHQ